MKLISILSLGFMPFLLNPTFSLANDTTVAEAAGGIEFKKSNDISMEKEVLTLSANKVRVEYEFLNKTKQSIKERIYFPMPFRDSFDLSCWQQPGRLQNFKVWVNGQLVNSTETVQAKLPSGEDVTSKLKRRGLSDQDIANYSGVTILCEGDAGDPTLVEQHNESLKKLGLSEVDRFGLIQEWLVSYLYYWDQEFPPEQVTHISHEYAPATGGSSGNIDFLEKGFGIKSTKELAARFNYAPDLCVDDGTFRAAKKAEQKLGGSLRQAVVEYVLVTGANWAGPIKDFTLNLKKSRPTDVVSLCFDGDFKKTSPLLLSTNKKNFVPNKNLAVLFLYYDPDYH